MGKFVFLALVLQICLTFCRTESVKFDWVHFNKSGGTFTNADEGKKTVADYLNRYASYSFWGSPSLNNSQCKIDMEAILQEANGLNFWALKILDASAKLPSGILSGNLNQFGDFDECLSAKGAHGDRSIKGKYCLAEFEVKAVGGKTNEKVQVLDDAVHAHRILTNKLSDPGHRIAKVETFVWGICIPSSCTEKEVETAINYHLEQISNNGPFQFDVKINREVCYVEEKKEFSITKLLVTSLFVIIFLLTISDFFIDFDKLSMGNSKVIEVAKCFSIKKNWASLVKTNPSDDDIECVNGARFLNAIGLLLSHKQMAMLFTPTINRTAMGQAFSKSWTMLGRSAILYTDSFIMISGMFASYSFVKTLDKEKTIKFKEKLINRIFRFTPNLIGTILFCTYIMNDFNSGPIWGLVVTKYSDLCKKNMWKNLLYIHNYFGFEEMCLTHTHQIGMDMQLFLVSPIFVYLLWKFPKKGSIILVLSSIASTWLRYEVTQREKLSTLIYNGISVERLWRTASLSYILPTHRLTVYLCGVMVGYYLRRNGKSLKLNRFQIIIGWTSAFAAGLFAMFGFYKSSFKGYVYNPVESASFNAFAPLLWVIFITWALLACINGYGGIFNSFLSWKYFRFFSKISYAVYLTQFPVFFYGIGSERTAQFYKGFHSLLDTTELIIILGASLALTLTFDIPCQELKKKFLTSSKVIKKDKSELSLEMKNNEEINNNNQILRKRLQSRGT